VKSVGTRGNGPLQFSTPHAISVDAKGLVYVADRGNSRMIVLDNDLNQKAVWDNIGAPWAVCISQGPHQISTRRILSRRATASTRRP
jgi:hypothetical protein